MKRNGRGGHWSGAKYRNHSGESSDERAITGGISRGGRLEREGEMRDVPLTGGIAPEKVNWI